MPTGPRRPVSDRGEGTCVEMAVLRVCHAHGLSIPLRRAHTKSADSPEGRAVSCNSTGSGSRSSNNSEGTAGKCGGGAGCIIVPSTSSSVITNAVAGLSSATAKATLIDVLSTILDPAFRDVHGVRPSGSHRHHEQHEPLMSIVEVQKGRARTRREHGSERRTDSVAAAAAATTTTTAGSELDSPALPTFSHLSSECSHSALVVDHHYKTLPSHSGGGAGAVIKAVVEEHDDSCSYFAESRTRRETLQGPPLMPGDRDRRPSWGCDNFGGTDSTGSADDRRDEHSSDDRRRTSSSCYGANASLASGIEGGGLALVKRGSTSSGGSGVGGVGHVAASHHKHATQKKSDSTTTHGTHNNSLSGHSEDGPSFIPIEQVLNEESQNAVLASLRQRSLLRMLAVQPPARFLRQNAAANAAALAASAAGVGGGGGGGARQPRAPLSNTSFGRSGGSSCTAAAASLAFQVARAPSDSTTPSKEPRHLVHHPTSDLAPISRSCTGTTPDNAEGEANHENSALVRLGGVSDAQQQQLLSADGNLSSMAAASVASCNRSQTHEVHEVREAEDELGFVMINGYILLEEIGKGKFGAVFLASSASTGVMRAIKIVPKSLLRRQFNPLRGIDGTGMTITSESPEQVLQREIAIMKKLRHRNIVALLEVIDDPSDANMYLVMPFVERGPIVKTNPDGTCTPLDIDVARGYLRQITAGLQYLHEHRVCHRDLKPENLLLGSDGVVYLADFGVSDFCEDLNAPVHETRGTPAFTAPECIEGDAFALPPTDIWALGVTAYMLLYGRLPFRGHNLAELNARILRGDPDYSPPYGAESETYLYQDATNLLRWIFDRNPKTRPTIVEIRKHRFFRGRWSMHDGASSGFSTSHLNSGVNTPSGASASIAAARHRHAGFAELTVDVSHPSVLPLNDAPPFVMSASQRSPSTTGPSAPTVPPSHLASDGSKSLGTPQSTSQTASSNSRSTTLPRLHSDGSGNNNNNNVPDGEELKALSMSSNNSPTLAPPPPIAPDSQQQTTAAPAASGRIFSPIIPGGCSSSSASPAHPTSVLIADRFGPQQLAFVSSITSLPSIDSLPVPSAVQGKKPQGPVSGDCDRETGDGGGSAPSTAQPSPESSGTHNPNRHARARPPGLPPIEIPDASGPMAAAPAAVPAAASLPYLPQQPQAAAAATIAAMPPSSARALQPPPPTSTSTTPTSTTSWSGRLIESGVRLEDGEIETSMTPLLRKAIVTGWGGATTSQSTTVTFGSPGPRKRRTSPQAPPGAK